MRRQNTSESGAAAILVAALMIGLLGIAAVALDGSNGYRARSDAQRAADAAALAAAWEDCTGSGDPVSTGLAAAAANGYATGTSVSTADGNWTATVADTLDASFGNAVGVGSLDVTVTATARCENVPVGSYALFSGGIHCNNSVSVTGSSSTINGGVHSNSDIHMTGSSSVVNGIGTAVGNISSDVTWNPTASNPSTVPSPLGYPVNYDVADYRPTGSVAVAAGANYHDFGADSITVATLTARGLWDAATSTITDGIYYTTGNVDISGGSINGKATFVTDVAPGSSAGTIQISASTSLTPYDATGLLMFSTHQKNAILDHNSNCTSQAVKVSGSTMNWQGIIFAPGGEAQISASSNASITGAVYSLALNLSGSTISITYDTEAGVTTPRIGLRE